MSEVVDVAVVGAGAAGLMAATVAARAGRRVVLLEKQDRAGLKILISGGGRCNLTTTREGRDLEAQYGRRRGRWLRHALRSFPPRALRMLVEEGGVALREEDLEKVFPVSGRAGDVLDALLRNLTAAGVQLRTGAPMTGLECSSSGFALSTPAGVLQCGRVVLATGGLSYPRTGTTGDGYAACADLGHSIVQPVPALAPLAVDTEWPRRLAGITVDAELVVADSAGRVLVCRRRPMLFTHKGLSGPGPMDVSGSIEEVGGGCTLRIDFAPDQQHDALSSALLDAARAHGRRRVHQALPRQLPERLRLELTGLAGADVPLAELRRERRDAVVRAVKRTALAVDRSLGFAHAEVTRGGVAIGEVDPETMESRLVPGLHVCGELLDVDGPIGGFNFQAAFATGRLAGLAAAGGSARSQ